MKPETKEKLKRVAKGIGKTLWEIIKLALLTENGPVLYIVTDVAKALHKLTSDNVLRAFITLGLSALYEKVRLKLIKVIDVKLAEENPEEFDKLIAQYDSSQIVFSHEAMEALA